MKENDAEISALVSKEDIQDYKRRLFAEKVMLSSERAEIAEEREALNRERKAIARERRQLEKETKQLSAKIGSLRESAEYERKRLKSEANLLDGKQKIIERAYRSLDSDRLRLNMEYDALHRERENLKRLTERSSKEMEEYATGIFFRGVNNQVALKKRYKDLMKIYHPDNIAGDHDIIIKIREEYEDLCRRFGMNGKRA
ncbi:MAG: hypothetical protein BWY61_00689 [Firmicutes bacterium ADurb.Bin354]|nr:MAG: hypothetical protein BWY61_00689 [Firmicutes bacterium ADurb.Bin354]